MAMDIDIIDTHFHIWDLDKNYYPWLTDRITPRSFGDYASIRRNYRLEDFKADIGTRRVVKAVHVQAEFDPRDPVRETQWLQSVADESGGMPEGIVAFTDLGAPNAEEILEGHAAYRNVRGIRQLIHQYRFDPEISYPLANPVWRANFGLLRKFGMTFDLNLFSREMPDAAAFVREHPDIQFIAGHMGMPARREDDRDLAAWHSGMAALAQAPNVAVKIGGFGIADRHWTIEKIKPLFDYLVDIFGVERCMFGSNYPVESLSSTYEGFWTACETLTEGFSDSELRQIFHDNAARLYRL